MKIEGRSEGGAGPSLSTRSIILIAGQFLLIGIIAATGPMLPNTPWGIVLFYGGITIGLWAVWVMRVSRLRIQPEIASGATLITRGPYRFVRHPMYLAVLLTTLGWVTLAPALPRCAVWGALAGVLVVKLRYEERLLRAKFPEYAAYASRTKRIVPGVW